MTAGGARHRRMAFAWTLTPCLALTILLAGAVPAFATEVVFADPDLAEVVRATLAIPEPLPITDSAMAGLKELGAGNANIDSLVGLEYATELTELTLGANRIADLAPISGLTKLAYLDLLDNQITDISPIAGLPNLTTLDLRNNPVSSLSPLSGLSGLTRLGIRGTLTSDISPLSGLTAVTDLDLADNQITDLSPLSGMAALSALNVMQNQLSSLAPLSGLTNLTVLRATSNHISDLSPLAAASDLTAVYVEGNDIDNLAPLAGKLGAGDTLRISLNYLDLTPGTPDMDAITAFINAGVAVGYKPQVNTTPPVLAAIGDATVNELNPLIFQALASDSNGNTLRFSLAPGAPAGATIDPNTGVFSWVPSEDQGPGSFPVTVVVTDGVFSDSTSFTVTVNELTPVYRFFNVKAGVHFYTASESEKNNVVAKLGYLYRFEGVSYQIGAANPTNSVPLYRFYNAAKGVHFYTASVAERDNVIAKFGYLYRFEGVAYHVSLAPTSMPVFRFFNREAGVHFYTASVAERDNVIDELDSIYTYEGIGYYVGQ